LIVNPLPVIVHEVDFGAGQVPDADRIDEQLHAGDSNNRSPEPRRLPRSSAY
jgi:hypothetical protein